MNAQPLRIHHLGKTLAIAHNGNLVNARQIRGTNGRRGFHLSDTTDSEVVPPPDRGKP